MRTRENIEYFILTISQKEVNLLKWQNKTIKEVRDGVFPILFKDDYEYSKPSRGTSFGNSLKNFEKDKSIMKKERFAQFLRGANKKLKGYLNQDSTLLLIGTDKDRADFKRVSDYNHLIKGEISGSYSASKLSYLRQSISGFLANAV